MTKEKTELYVINWFEKNRTELHRPNILFLSDKKVLPCVSNQNVKTNILGVFNAHHTKLSNSAKSACYLCYFSWWL